MEKRPENKVLIMQIPKPLHDEVKKRAIKHNMTMTRYVVCLINEQIIKENRSEQIK